MKRIVVDLDGTICNSENGDYSNSIPNIEFIHKLQEYKEYGFDIIIYTSRNVRTYENNVGKINAITLPIIVDWLKKYNVPFDEIFVGKPWCGFEGFYVDDKSIRPDEFIQLTYNQIQKLLGI